ncbi:pyridoxal phosphate-dependent aminotransferase [Streptomyces sp. NPDC059568]|uniref:pyridoxal phosphate-dependent aminotransferase n=1 Tax=Streptomyces sp. NPDC059568 TaxID=3346868 RepID=UPI0036CF9FF5
MQSTVHGGTSGLRLDWNECATGPSPVAVARVVAGAGELHRYPRGLLGEVTEAVARENGVEAESVLLTNGVDEAVDLALSLVGTAYFVSPGFDGYLDRALVLGRTARAIPLDEQWEPVLDPAELGRGSALFLAQPHNPTGHLFRSEWVDAAVAGAEVAFLDTTYADFAAPDVRGVLTDPYPLGSHPGLLLFRSFSKSHGLAGVRLGALIGAPGLISRLRSRQRFHSVNSIALHALAGSLEDPGHRLRLCAQVLADRPRYVEVLGAHPVFAEVRDTHTNFVVARCRDGLSSADVAGRLADRDVWIKDCGPLGLPGWLRISVGTLDDLDRLVHELSAIDPAHTPPHTTSPAPDLATSTLENVS